MPAKQPKNPFNRAVILWEGPSLIDGSPIVVIGLPGSSNTKTGNMAQTYIIRADIDPVTASRTGQDEAICGTCPHRGTPNPARVKGWADNRSCYVNLIHGPNQVYKAYRAGKYKHVDDIDPNLHYGQALKEWSKGASLRLGTYGDPLAVPSWVWSAMLETAKTHTGYTHQKGMLNTACKPPKSAAPFGLMISADNMKEARDYNAAGYRTFRVIPLKEYKTQGLNSLLNNEILCPASKEAGYKTTCHDCRLCQGNTIKAKSIAIVAHGAGAKHAGG
jgi:hypothetical protein